jgi:hypothetical protein
MLAAVAAWAWVYRSDTAWHALLATLAILCGFCVVVIAATSLASNRRIDEVRAARHARAGAAWLAYKKGRHDQ